MGEQRISEAVDEEGRQAFVKALLADVMALEQMIEAGRIEAGVRRIGAEQEMFLVGKGFGPAPVAEALLEKAGEERLTTEIGRFNLEANLSPLLLGGDCFAKLEGEIEELTGVASRAAREVGAEVLLAGILPTLRVTDLGIENLTHRPRYEVMNRALRSLRGEDFHLRIEGLDELETTHDNMMFESCNTSFQVHLQVGAQEFAPLYNLAQAVTAPVLAAAVNSPVLLGRRLWHETRIALFARSIELRPATSAVHAQRIEQSRVQFGERWIEESALEIFREDIARFRVMITAEAGEDPREVLARGEVPDLRALRVHNGTIYRWNRPCYGVSEGVPHLRIENRVLPAGPTRRDEVANAAFFLGLMVGLAREVPRVDQVMEFADAKANFFAAARYGLKAQLTWFGGRSFAAPALILGELLPRAREGLRAEGVDGADVDRYLGVIEERVRSGQTGAQWTLSSLAAMEQAGKGTADTRDQALCAAMLAHQQEGRPVHEWPLAEVADDPVALVDGYRTVAQIMTTDLVTLRPDDIVAFAASVMDWRRMRHIPVEDEGRLVGIVSYRDLLRLVARGEQKREDAGAAGAPASGEVTVASIMHADPVRATLDMSTQEAMRCMKEHGIGCLPVVEGDRLVGMVTERELLDLASSLLERALQDRGGEGKQETRDR
ncbi:CBS domain-containing protein [Chondromyces apiculatus]|uniref:CBS domain-containing protein n=1 Tax=Chondromyces apiculatus DSM 436 TaxID=1192034 RepID=A0A017T0M7_9BACT|nr:CBS domain-containing protein [Chondromyces apiculatus]EYF02814.1 Hypothetical protein CAP_6549 [Chondromyces apiculatus DSM 436]